MTMTVSPKKLERIQEFIRICEGGALADALMTLFIAYEGQEARIERLKEKHARLMADRESS